MTNPYEDEEYAKKYSGWHNGNHGRYLEKLEKLYKTPYEKEYSEIYNRIYLLDETHLQHTQYEINLIETLCKNKQSWLDVACGTGYHLDNVKSDVLKFGVDRSPDMITYAKENTDSSIEYICSDINDFAPDITFDLVTFLWMGYVHQPSLTSVLNTIYAASEKVSKSGNFLMTFCDPLYIFENSPSKGVFCGRGDINFDGLIWSYSDEVNEIQYENLIAPNKFRILDILSSNYTDVEEVVYTKANEEYWKKSAFLFRGKK